MGGSGSGQRSRGQPIRGPRARSVAAFCVFVVVEANNVAGTSEALHGGT